MQTVHNETVEANDIGLKAHTTVCVYVCVSVDMYVQVSHICDHQPRCGVPQAHLFRCAV